MTDFIYEDDTKFYVTWGGFVALLLVKKWRPQFFFNK